MEHNTWQQYHFGTDKGLLGLSLQCLLHVLPIPLLLRVLYFQRGSAAAKSNPHAQNIAQTNIKDRYIDLYSIQTIKCT
jgi:hypothetical protein